LPRADSHFTDHGINGEDTAYRHLGR